MKTIIFLFIIIKFIQLLSFVESKTWNGIGFYGTDSMEWNGFYLESNNTRIKLIVRENEMYEDARLVHNPKINIMSKVNDPDIIYYCNSTKEVSEVIKYGTSMATKGFHIRSGRHNYEGLCTGQNAHIIDVSGISYVELSHDKMTVKVGGGTNLTYIYKKLWEKGLSIPGGTCPSVRVGGLTLGGGFGFNVRTFGLLCDHAVEFEMVEYNGETIRATPNNENKDLFWALCGAGNNNFGVVTSISFKPIKVANLTSFFISWKWTRENVINLTNCWFQTIKTMPAALNMHLGIKRLNTADFLLTTYGRYYGKPEKFRNVVGPILTCLPANEMTEENIQYIPYIQAVNEVGEWELKEMNDWVSFESTSIFVMKELSNESLNEIFNFVNNNPLMMKIDFLIKAMGGNIINKKAENRSSFAHRATLASIQIMVFYEQADQAETIELLMKMRQFMVDNEDGAEGAYVNSPSLWLKDYLKEYYGSSLPRLREIKQKYDPNNVFAFQQSITAT